MKLYNKRINTTTIFILHLDNIKTTITNKFKNFKNTKSGTYPKIYKI